MAGERLREALQKYRRRYREADRKGRFALRDEFCKLTGYPRKHAMGLLTPCEHDGEDRPRRPRGLTYSAVPDQERIVAALDDIGRAPPCPIRPRKTRRPGAGACPARNQMR